MSDKKTHTPGPWRQVLMLNGAVHLMAPDGSRVGRVEGETNARLIAAAPEMLEALDLITRTSPDVEAVRMAQAVIQKARGR